MIRKGLMLLNNYYYDWMNCRYEFREPVDDMEVQVFLQLVLCFGGVLGLRPNMTPYLPDDKRHLLNNALHNSDIKLQKDLLASIERPHIPWEGKTDLWNQNFRENAEKELRDRYNQDRQDREDKLMRLEARGPYEAMPRELHPKAAKDAPWFAMKFGVPAHEAENLVEWELRKPFVHEEECLTEIIQKTLNTRINDEPDLPLLRQYTTIMTDLVFRGMFGNNYMTEKQEEYQANLKIVVERIAWQLSEMQAFVLFCAHPAGITLEHLPVQVSSGTYEENPQREPTQGELIDIMAQELSNLPRFTGYAKALQEENGMQRVLKRKITTIPYTGSQILYEIPKNKVTENAYKYGLPRTQIEEALKNRRESWKQQPSKTEWQMRPFQGRYIVQHPTFIVPNAQKPPKKDDDEPPPRGY
jgi:hypothetical protein